MVCVLGCLATSSPGPSPRRHFENRREEGPGNEVGMSSTKTRHEKKELAAKMGQGLCCSCFHITLPEYSP